MSVALPRKKDEICGNCTHFAVIDGIGAHGECRALPPRAEQSPNRSDALWPLVKNTDFCGEFDKAR